MHGQLVSMDYHSFFKEKLQQLKDNGSYRYFLEVNKSAQHFPNFYYTDEKGQQHAAVNWCSNDYLGMGRNPVVLDTMQSVPFLMFVSIRFGGLLFLSPLQCDPG